MFIIIPAKLDKEVRKNIRNKNYSQEDLESIYSRLKREIEEKKLGLSRGKNILMALASLNWLIGLIALFNAGRISISIVMSILIPVLIIMGVYFYIRYAQIGKLIRQFNKAIEKGYPELSNKLKLV